ncbi:hypothetical protein WDW37_10450 [Bdellovibrionota bacterium FG-1]
MSSKFAPNWAQAIALLGLYFAIPTARADIAVDLECTIPASIPASSDFDCNLLKQRFFKEKAIPFVKDSTRTTAPAHQLHVSVSRLPVQNGFNYETVISEKATSSTVKLVTFLSDGTNPTSALQAINATIQKGVLTFSRPNGEASTTLDTASMTYGDPSKQPVAPKFDGRWILKPSADIQLSKYSATPLTLGLSGAAAFKYSGEQNRYMASINGRYNRQSVPVTTGNTQELYGVDTHSASAATAMIIGLDKHNHVNFGASANAQTAPLQNINVSASTNVGIEYNPLPFLTQDSNSFAVGCNVGPTYYNFSVPNVLEKQQFVAINQSCAVVGSILLDKRRGTSVTGQIAENWIVNAPSVVGVGAMVSANIRLTDRLTFAPTVVFSWQTKSISTASSKYVPSLEGLSPQELANQEVVFAAQSSSASALGVNAYGSLSYTFGDGVNRVAQDQRGSAIEGDRF